MRKPIDLTNQRFGYLKVIERNGTEFGQPLWKCRWATHREQIMNRNCMAER